MKETFAELKWNKDFENFLKIPKHSSFTVVGHSPTFRFH